MSLRFLACKPVVPCAWVLLCAACTPTTYQPLRDRPDYVTRVLEDVTAMMEGMANAHSADRVVLRDPNYRSSRQPGTN